MAKDELRIKEKRAARLLTALSVPAAGAAVFYIFLSSNLGEALLMAFLAAVGVLLLMAFVTSWILFGGKDTNDPDLDV